MRKDALIILVIVTVVCLFFTAVSRAGYQRRVEYEARERAICMRMLRAARTSIDTVFVLGDHPSDVRGPSCAAWLP